MPPNDPMLPAQCGIRSVVRETHDTFTLEVDSPSTVKFEPGQFSMLWAFGIGEIPVSISGDSADATRLVYTIRSVGQVSKALVSAEPGTSVGVRGHFGKGWPVEVGPWQRCDSGRWWNWSRASAACDLSRAAAPLRLRQAAHPLRHTHTARCFVPKRTGLLGEAATDAGPNYCRFGWTQLARARGGGNQTFPLRAVEPITIDRHDVRSGSDDALSPRAN